jgi:drug/metabolite transporter (DMT)-like permease
MKPLTYCVLAVSVLVVSTSSLLIRVIQAEHVSSLAIAFWRLAAASVFLWVFFGSQRKVRDALQATTRKHYALMFASGAFLALHFASWIASLAYTSVASSTALVSTNPVWLVIFSWLVLKETPDRWIWFGVAASLLGSILIFSVDFSTTYAAGATAGQTSPGSSGLFGNALALFGSITVCGYLLIGRRLAHAISTPIYISVVFSSAALVMLLIVLAAGVPLAGYSTTVWMALAGLAIGPQLIGHGGISWSLRHLAPTMVAVAILGEPVASALLAWWLLGESVGWLQGAGFVLIMAGIVLAANSTAQPDRQ